MDETTNLETLVERLAEKLKCVNDHQHYCLDCDRSFGPELLDEIDATLKALPPAPPQEQEPASRHSGLRACPFCGGDAYAVRTVNGTQMFKVGCASCGIEFKAAWYRDADQPTKDIKTLWNTRNLAASPPQAQELEEHIEALAEYAHEAWCGWMRHLFSKCKYPNPTGIHMPSEWAERWLRQMNTSYQNLSESEKESDRKEARRILAIVALPPAQGWHAEKE